jgi:hypothetical protein
VSLYNELIRRYGDREEIEVIDFVARGLFDKAVILALFGSRTGLRGWFGIPREASDTFWEIRARYGKGMLFRTVWKVFRSGLPYYWPYLRMTLSRRR